ncbi:MAG: hypothetical protein RL012_511, partial [Bacteroidota bacterium]
QEEGVAFLKEFGVTINAYKQQ